MIITSGGGIMPGVGLKIELESSNLSKHVLVSPTEQSRDPNTKPDIGESGLAILKNICLGSKVS